MKTALTNTIGDLILDQVEGPVLKPKIKTEYFSDTQSTWKAFDSNDVEGRTITLETDNKRYQAVSYMPPAKKASLTLNNFDQIYSTGAATTKSSILKKNLLIRAWSGYDLGTYLLTASQIDPFTGSINKYHTKVENSKILLDISSYTGSSYISQASLGLFYDTGTYAHVDTNYSTGTDENLSSPDDNYDTIANFVPCSALDDDLLINIGESAGPSVIPYQWINLNVTPGSTAVFLGQGAGNNYGEVKLRAGGQPWTNFALSANDGMQQIDLPKTGDTTTDGGYVQYYYVNSAWTTAFSGNSSNIIIALNGSIYKGSIAADNLVNNEAGLIGLAGGGTYTPATSFYAYPGYFAKTIKFSQPENELPKQYKFTASDNKFSFKYRTSNLSDLYGADWTGFSSVATGANIKTIDADSGDKYLQYLIRFEHPTWDTGAYISTASYITKKSTQLFKQGTFVVDDPKYSEKSTIDGRDYLRKALETEISIPLLSAVPITDVIAMALTRAKVPYDTATWNLSATTVSLNSTFSESLESVSAYKVIDKLMDDINAGDDDWKFRFNDDGQAEVKIIPTATEADFLANYRLTIERSEKSFDSDSQLQRITMINKSMIVDAESTLASAAGTAAASLTITYATAIYVGYTDVNDTIISETSRTNNSVTFAMNSGAAYDIDVTGNTPKNAITDEIWAEAGNSDNIISKDGSTFKKTNEFITQDIAQKYVDYTIGQLANPAFKVSLAQVANPFLELNDNGMIFDKATFTNNIFNLSKITETWSNPALKHTLELKDTGITFTDFIWDRNGVLSGISDLDYDTGLVWDFDVGVNATEDTADYADTKPVLFN